MKIALLQAAGTPGDRAANLATIERAARDAARAGARLLITPEAFVTGYNIGRDALADLAEPADAPQLADIARNAYIAILAGYAERDGDTIYNSARLVDRDGATLANYRKTHMFGDLDRSAFTPGDAVDAIATLDGVRVGVLVCYDIEFPEAARALASRGAELIAVPTSLMAPSQWIAELLVPARAAENQVYVAYANRVGSEGDLVYVGRSSVAGPDGGRISAGAYEETLLFADVDPQAIERARARMSYLRDRRTDLY